uniref:Uncharacterized protein n=1 Tax=Seriola lalandi dorsalis TaxID=1841481 RepID=A0A3B4XET9_SERLL
MDAHTHTLTHTLISNVSTLAFRESFIQSCNACFCLLGFSQTRSGATGEAGDDPHGPSEGPPTAAGGRPRVSPLDSRHCNQHQPEKDNHMEVNAMIICFKWR